MVKKPEAVDSNAYETVKRRAEELERWFQTQDRQIRFLERERQKLSALVNHTDAGFIVFDAGLNVRWMNNVCRTWFGGVQSATPGQRASCHELLCGSRTVCAECPTARSLAEAIPSHREIRLDVDGNTRHIYATAMPIKTPDNRVDETILMLQDITDLEVLRRSQEALVRAKESAESASRAKSEFLANMSHEVRTPMTGVLGMTGLLLDMDLSEEQREYVKIIQSSGEALLSIINDILDFSRIEAGRLTIDPIPFDLTAAIDEVVALVSGKTQAVGMELIVRYAPDARRRFIGDAGRIRQVLLNLVGNAIKFTEKGHVFINVDRVEGDEGVERLRISVEDTGIGIEPDKLEAVFDKFTQADGSITRRYGGTGLGLAISKQLVELMGGEIAVTSEPGAGSTFSFTLTLPVDAEAALEPAAAENLEGVRVLVIHRHDKVRGVLAEQLAACGARATGVPGGATAVTELHAAQQAGDPYRIAVVAHDVPDMTVEALATMIKGDPLLRKLVLVMLTTIGEQGDAERLRAVGFDAYLTQPARPSKLADVLSAVWSVKQRGVREVFVTRHTLSEVQRSTTAPAVPDAVSRGRVLVAEDNAINRRAAARMLELLGCTVDVAAHGREAVDMIARHGYDLVFMDCQMPQLDGYEATREIRRREARGARRTTIIAMTAHALPGDREKCYEAGMDDFVAKPIRKAGIAAVVDRHLPQGRNEFTPADTD
ncbi:MAG TPA: ATP-binding protein [Candidatus Krumholzibacteria bacterium]|nr:ATP-binding protein [Candidatus Krumholzibacteria bacterium]